MASKGSPSSGRSRRSITKPNKEDKSQTTLKTFFQVVPKEEKQEKFKATLGNESGSDFKEDLKENVHEGDTKDDRYVKVLRKWNTCSYSFNIEKIRKYLLSRCANAHNCLGAGRGVLM